MAALCEIGAAASHATIPFTMTLDRIGGFRDAGVAWLGADVAPPELERLAVHCTTHWASRDSASTSGRFAFT